MEDRGFDYPPSEERETTERTLPESIAVQVILLQGLISRGEAYARELDERGLRHVIREIMSALPSLVEYQRRVGRGDPVDAGIAQSIDEALERIRALTHLIEAEASRGLPAIDEQPFDPDRPLDAQAISALMDAWHVVFRESQESRSAMHRLFPTADRLRKLAAEILRRSEGGNGLSTTAAMQDNGAMERLERMEGKIDRLAEAISLLGTSLGRAEERLSAAARATDVQAAEVGRRLGAMEGNIETLGRQFADYSQQAATKDHVRTEVDRLRNENGGVVTKGWVDRRLLAGAVGLLLILFKDVYWPLLAAMFK